MLRLIRLCSALLSMIKTTTSYKQALDELRFLEREFLISTYRETDDEKIRTESGSAVSIGKPRNELRVSLFP
jgi:hypothetical protein